jgi:hypothetical protein
MPDAWPCEPPSPDSDFMHQRQHRRIKMLFETIRARVAAGTLLDGYHVSVVQEPLTSLQDDIAATKRILASIHGFRR